MSGKASWSFTYFTSGEVRVGDVLQPGAEVRLVVLSARRVAVRKRAPHWALRVAPCGEEVFERARALPMKWSEFLAGFGWSGGDGDYPYRIYG